jgi:phosphate transport system substrate-binding protein
LAEPPPRSPGYLRPDGSLEVVGDAGLTGPIARLNALFERTHPGFRFQYSPADTFAALYSLAYDATAFAPVGAEFPAGASGPYAILVHAEPFGVRIAHGSLAPEAKVSPLAVIVNPANPLTHLSAAQVTHIFTVGGRQRDLTHWGQVGGTGGWADREIHPCGLPESDHYPSEDGGFGEYLFVRKFGGAHSAANYRMLTDYSAVTAAVAADPQAIGVTALNRLTPGVKVLAINGTAWATPATGSAEDIVRGDYAYDRYLYLYVRRTPGQPLTPFLKAYLALALSPEGQAALTGHAEGYLGLNAVEVGEERAKILGGPVDRIQAASAGSLTARTAVAEEPEPTAGRATGAEASAPAASAVPSPATAGSASPAVGPLGTDPLAPPRNAPYLLPDGSIYVAGNDLLAPFFDQLNALFLKSHPGFKFTFDLHASSLALSGIIAGKSAFGPMARDAPFPDRNAFAARYGYPPTDVQIGWDNTPDSDHFPPNGKFPPGIWVNARNPIPALTVQEVAAILTTGGPGGDITRWGQIAGDEGPVGANGGDWAKRAIHIYLPALRGLPILSTTRMRFGGRPWAPGAEFLPMGEDVINAVANDPFGIGFIGWWPTDEGWDRQAELGAKVRLMPLSADRDSRISHGGPGDLYPLSGGIHLFINRAPGAPVEPWLAAYVQLALSKEGQDILASLTRTDGFIPLDPDQLESERAKVR